MDENYSWGQQSVYDMELSATSLFSELVAQFALQVGCSSLVSTHHWEAHNRSWPLWLYDAVVVDFPFVMHSACKCAWYSKYRSAYYWQGWSPIADLCTDPTSSPAFVMTHLQELLKLDECPDAMFWHSLKKHNLLWSGDLRLIINSAT
jgi:hypothetical protein